MNLKNCFGGDYLDIEGSEEAWKVYVLTKIS
jgi:hypothetical protein